MGACLLANEPTGIGQAMLAMRVKGASWKEIADEFNLPNPSAARKAFSKHTGINDFKTKGPALLDVKPGPATVAKKQADKVVKEAVTELPKASDMDDAIKFTDILEEKPDSLKRLKEKTGHSQAEIEYIKMLHSEGKGYTAIKQAIGNTDFSKIDEVVWDHLLEKHGNQVWSAYKSKPTSESGFKAVQDKVISLRQKGLTTKQIAGMPDAPPESVIKAIQEGTWKMPPMGSTQPIIPPAPPQTYGGPIAEGTNFAHKSNSEMMKWINDLGNDLTSQQVDAIQSYTGSGYLSINRSLRYGSSHDVSSRVAGLDGSMRPVPFDVRVVRNVSNTDVFGTHDMSQLVGTVFTDPGYMSTTIQPAGVFGGDVQMIIDVPKGSMARYVQNISSHKSEYEMLLARETKMIVKRVEEVSSGYGGKKYKVYMGVI